MCPNSGVGVHRSISECNSEIANRSQMSLRGVTVTSDAVPWKSVPRA